MTNSESPRLLIEKIVAFLGDIGIGVRVNALDEQTFLPGIKVMGGMLVVDESRLKYPGDMLHEAGHLAVVTHEARLAGRVGQQAHEEMMAIAWSYAAATPLHLDASVVLHAGGYEGWREGFIAALADGTFTGVDMLRQIEMTVDESRAAELGVAPFPHMIRWLL